MKIFFANKGKRLPIIHILIYFVLNSTKCYLKLILLIYYCLFNLSKFLLFINVHICVCVFFIFWGGGGGTLYVYLFI